MFWWRSPVRVAVERGPLTWALAAADHRSGVPWMATARLWAGGQSDGPEATEALRQMRLSARLPYGATALVWPMAGDAAAPNLDTRPGAAAPLPKARVLRQRLRPFVHAGGRVKGIVWPHEAAARVVASHGWDTACLAVLHAGAACLATVDGDRVQARYVTWAPDVDAGAEDDTGRLLKRFHLAARLAPHFREWLEGEPARVLAVCGSLPDLRPAMVPLVEELDREIDVLDAALPGVSAEIADAAALQLAWAVASAPR